MDRQYNDLFVGEKVRLRAMEPEDLSMLYELENSPGMWDVGSATVPYSKYMLKQFIAGAGDIYTDKQLRLMVIALDANEPVGCIDLMNYSPRHARAEVGVALLHSCRGKGYAADALALLEEYARGCLGIHQLYAYVSVDNVASISLFSRSGYEKANRLIDWVKTGDGYADVILFQKIFKKTAEILGR